MIRPNKKLLIILFLSVILLTGCNNIHPLSELRDSGKRSTIINENVIVQSFSPTPSPEIKVREPEKSHSPIRISYDAPSEIVPEFYQQLDFPGIPYCIYGYTNTSGECCYRVYGEVDVLEDENITETLIGFFQSSIFNSDYGIYILEVNKDSFPVKISSEKPVHLIPCPVPTNKEISSYIRKRKSETEKYEKERENAEKNGDPLPVPTIWDGQPLLSESTVPVNLPYQVKAVQNIQYLYYYENPYGERVYRRYATPDGFSSGFYPSDQDGNITIGSFKIDTSLDFDQSSFRSGKKLIPSDTQIQRIPSEVILSDGRSVTVYTIHHISQ